MGGSKGGTRAEYYKEWVANNLAKVRAYRKAYYAANREEAKKEARKFYWKNPEHGRAVARARYETEKQRINLVEYARLKARLSNPALRDLYRNYHREYLREWRERNLERGREYVRRRRAWRIGAQGSHTEAQWMARVGFYGWRCRYCDCGLTRTTLTLDHAIPLCRGGSEWPANLVPACLSCNSRKHNHTLFEFVGD